LISGNSYFNDLWQFDGQEWTWVSGNDQPNQEGVYGEKGVPDSNNVPGGREIMEIMRNKEYQIPPSRTNALNWIDLNGNFWLFGG
jgi:hypothetical protein